MRKTARQTRLLALSALFVALSVVVLYLGCFLEVVDLTVAAIASLLVVLAVIELREGYAIMIWLATSILSLMLLPSKFIAVEYACFMGCYPLIKALSERLPTVLSWVIKIVFVNLALGILVVLGHFVFGYPIESAWMLVATFLLATFTGVVFDIALTKLITLYFARLRKSLRIDRLVH